MRLVQVIVPEAVREDVVAVLEDEDIDYFLVDGSTQDGSASVGYFPVPTTAVESVLGRLREAGLGDDAHVVLIDAEADISAEFSTTDGHEYRSGQRERIARHELHTIAKERSLATRTFLTLNVLSAILAVSGFLLDSTPVVVGAMVLAPLFDPPIAASVGTVLEDDALVRRGVVLQVLGVGVAVLGAMAFGGILNALHMMPTGLQFPTIVRIDPLPRGILTVIVAFGAGAAGILSLTTDAMTALVGVAIAATIVPSAAALGLAISMGWSQAAVNSFVTLLVNLAAINLAGLLTLWTSGFRPIREGCDATTEVLWRAALLVGVLVGLLAFLNV
ncbi:MAG: TIGR00341 family protein [Salinigranum sp.]